MSDRDRKHLEEQYIDFKVEISSLGEDKYSISIDSPGGDARVILQLPVTVQNDMKRLEQGDVGTTGLEKIGTLLFDAVFHRESKSVYDQSFGQLLPTQRLRLILRMSPTDNLITRLPWEILHDPMRGPLVLRKASIVRQLLMASPPQTGITNPPPPPIKVLLTAAQPKNQANTNAEREIRAIQDVLQPGQQTGSLQVQVDTHLTRERFQTYSKGGFHIWHFCGGGGISRDGLVEQLSFETEHGNHDPVNAGDLEYWIAGKGLQLVLLNIEQKISLKTALARSLASSLIHSGIPTVIEVHSNISTDSATMFSEVFYENLRKGAFVDTCVMEGRESIANTKGVSQPNWGIPVTYTRAFNVRLFSSESVEHAIVEDHGRVLSVCNEKIHQIQKHILSNTYQIISQNLSKENIHFHTLQMLKISFLCASLGAYQQRDNRIDSQGIAEFLETLRSPLPQSTFTHLDNSRIEYTKLFAELQQTVPSPVEPASYQYVDPYDVPLTKLTDAWLQLPPDQGMFKCVEIVRVIPIISRSRLLRALSIMAPAICTFHAEVVEEIAAEVKQIVEMYP